MHCTASSPWLPWLEGFLIILMTSPWKHHMWTKWMVVQVMHFVVQLGSSWGNNWGGGRGGLCCGQRGSLWGNGFELCLGNFLWVTELLSYSLGRLLMKVQQNFTVWGVFLSSETCNKFKRWFCTDWQFFVKLNVHLLCDPRVLDTSIYSSEMKTSVYKKTYSRMFIISYLTVKDWVPSPS